MPAMGQKLVTYLRDPEADFGKATEMIQYDPGLTANILKLANSVAFGGVHKVSSVRAALPRLGTQRVLDLVLTAAVARRLVGELPGFDLAGDELLRHSMFTAVAAEELARLLGIKGTETAFTVGLLHDLGILVMDPFVARDKAAFDARFEVAGETSFVAAERELLGIDHAEAGALVLKQWRFGDDMVAGVRWHHEPEQAAGHRELVDLVHLADALALSQGIGTGRYGLGYGASPGAIERLGLKGQHLEYVASATLDKVNELATLMT